MVRGLTNIMFLDDIYCYSPHAFCSSIMNGNIGKYVLIPPYTCMSVMNSRAFVKGWMAKFSPLISSLIHCGTSTQIQQLKGGKIKE